MSLRTGSNNLLERLARLTAISIARRLHLSTPQLPRACDNLSGVRHGAPFCLRVAATLRRQRHDKLGDRLGGQGGRCEK